MNTDPVRPQGFITQDEVSNFLKVNHLGPLGKAISSGLMKLTHLDSLNEAYIERAHLGATDFIDAMLEHLGIDYTVYQKDLDRIPKSGPFIVIANHPLGGIDGMIMIRLLLEARPDFKVMGNFLLGRVKPLLPHLLQVNPFEDYKNVRSNYLGIKSALEHVRNDHPLGIFPAGEVSTRQKGGKVSDRPWTNEALRFISKANVPVIPMCFITRNSELFYRLSSLSGTLRTAMLPREMTTQHNRDIKIRIGNKISASTLEKYPSADQLNKYLRSKTYLLEQGLKQNQARSAPHRAEEIVPPVCTDLLQHDVKYCIENDKLLFEFNQYQVIVTNKSEAENIVREIGRLREVSFRDVGEGTNTEIDLDKYDDYYEHLFIYDTDQNSIVGAYRMGMGKEIYPKYGINGFYLSELFHLDGDMHHVMQNCVELGRAFIAKKYQGKPMSLFLLWKGILMILLKEDLKYMLGGVSISDEYSSFSKSVMISFLKKNHYDVELAKSVKAKNEFKVILKEQEEALIHEDVEDNIKKLDRLIDEIDPRQGVKLPILLKKYLNQNVKLIGFNIDPKFNDALDGLMYVKLEDIPPRTLKSAIEEYQNFINRIKKS